MKTIVKITNRDDYEKAVKLLEGLILKGEEHLTGNELKWIDNITAQMAQYEEKAGMLPIDVQSVSEKETDVQKIAVALGYEPNLADIIRFKMLQKKLNQKSLAALLNMGEAKISHILSGKRSPDVDFLRGIHTTLGIDGNVLLETSLV